MNTIHLTTKCGDVIGRDAPDGWIFEGIPYAYAERFEYPVAVTDFGGSFDATKKPLEFPQDNTYIDDSKRFYTREFRRGESFEYAESPLTLNIITPKEPKSCPVLIFIHGGGFHTGKQSEHPAGTCFEYAKRGVILVSVSYRLNVFALYRCGNYYLYDQLCAIKWIKDNISDYGGDAENLSLIGQSAGAMSIFQLMYTDALAGSIKRAIMMSGAGFLPSLLAGYTKDKSDAFWDRIMHAAGCENDEQLKAVSTETLWRAWWDEASKPGNFRYIQPGIDGKMIPGLPSEIKKKGSLLDIPLMIGVTSQDMIFPLLVFNKAKSFALWSCRRKRKKVFLYFFDRVLPGNLYKAYHSSDLWYMFGNMDKCWRAFGEDDHALRDLMIDSVVRFIREDDPGWCAFTSAERKLRYFNTHGDEYVRPRDCLGTLLRNSFIERGPY